MPVPVQCEQCHAKYLIEDRFAGKRAKCKRCGHIMSIPLAEPDVVELDDTMATEGSSDETSPWGGPVPPPKRMPQGVTSQPGRAWRPQDVVVEREGEVAEIPLNAPFPTYVRSRSQAGPTIDWLVPAVILAFIGSLIAFGVVGQRALRDRFSPEQWEIVGGQLTGYTWGYVGFVLIGLFVLAGPITLACIATGAKIRRLDLPGSAYTRACAVAAVPALAIILVALGAANRMLDASLAMLILLASVPVAFLVLRFAFGFDWLTAGVAFAFAAVFGGAAVFATNKLSQKAAEAAFLRKEDTQRAMAQANAARQGSSPAPNVSRDVPTSASPTPRDNTPQVTLPSAEPSAPKPSEPRRTSEFNLRLLGGALNAYYASNNNTWPPNLAAAQATGIVSPSNLKSPYGPATGGEDYAYTPGPANTASASDLVLAYDRAEYQKGTGATVLFANLTIRWLDKANVDRALARSSEVAAQYASQPPPAVAANAPPPAVNTAPPRPPGVPPAVVTRPPGAGAAPGVQPPGADAAIQKEPVGGGFAEKVRAAAGDLVTGVEVVPLDRDVAAVIRPLTPSQAFAVVRNVQGEEAVEVWSGAAGGPPKVAGQLAFKPEAAVRSSYGLSADGQRILRITSFPKLSVKAVAVADGRELASVDLNEKLGTPTVLGILSGDRVLVRWEKLGKYGSEVIDLKLRRVVRQIDLPEHDPSPGNEAVSPDGRYFATTSRGKIRGELVNQLVLHTTFEGGVPRRFAIEALGGRPTIKTAGIAFSPDGSKVAALFTEAGNAVVVAWSVKTGKPLTKDGVVVPGNVAPLAPLAPFGAVQRVGPAGLMRHVGGAGMGVAGGGGRSLTWLAGGGAWLVGASQVMDAIDGRLIGELGAAGATDQIAAGDHAVYLPFRETTGTTGIAVVTFNPKSLPAAAPAAPPKAAGAAMPR